MMAYYFRSWLLAQVQLLSVHILAVHGALVKAFSVRSHPTFDSNFTSELNYAMM